jgi:hypothetical protein
MVLKRRLQMLAAGCLALGAAGCAYQPKALIDDHYATFEARLPEKDRVFVCSSYGCRTTTPFKFTEADIAHLKALMSPASTKTPEAERATLRTTLGWMEDRVDKVVGTWQDRPGDDGLGNGDPTQMDCVDVATNLSSYLLILQRHNLLRHHQVGSVMVKEDIRRGLSGWTHYAAIVKETGSGKAYAVDGWLMASGQPPEIVETERWYIDDKDLLFGTKSSVGANG